MVRTYSELLRLKTFEDRFEYLSLEGIPSESTFGVMRWLNQRFYTSYEWKQVRSWVILRDQGCDLGVPGHEIHTDLLVHHMNVVTLRDLQEGDPWILNPEYLITTSLRTHNAIHYGAFDTLPRGPIERRPGDTKLW